ncbi:hypothetical protein ABIE26_001517 [Pedobacter africanus]|uniref:Uncharacterized protein n=1 Tax=Pedobacter africanus TaxID=151894 RepID=A0ACC6KS59_9SPHI|nr:hypothetical protein [Pedobacter africanus]MDR6781994.1 hypothetical protein [Pedobacter africanus]
MKKLLFSALLLFCSVTIFAQSAAKKSSLFIGLGPSFPIGDFGLKKASDEKAGLAATGFYVDLGYQYQFSKVVGAIVILKGKIHGIAKDALNYTLPDGSGGSMSINTGTWKMGSVLAGLTQTFALSKSENFAIEFREAAGVQFTSTPEVNANYSIPGIGSSSGSQESQSATSFAYLAGMAFKYQLNSNLGLKLYGDFNNSNVNFKGYTATANGATITAPSSKQKTGTIDVGLGLTIGL